MKLRKIDKNHAFSYSLVSNYEGWLNADSDYRKYYDTSENPPDPAAFELEKKLQFYAQLFKLNVSKEYEKDDTALMLGKRFEDYLNMSNELMRDETMFTFRSNKHVEYKVLFNDDFITLVNNRINAQPRRQVEIKGVLPNGLNFIGYADEVYDNCIIDIKTTSNFKLSNYNTSLQMPLYLHFIDDFAVQRGFYQVTEFYRSKAAGKNEFTMKDTYMIESEKITEKQLTHFSDLCMDMLNSVEYFENDLQNYKQYFNN